MDIQSVKSGRRPSVTSPLIALIKSVYAAQQTANKALVKTVTLIDATGDLEVRCRHNVFASSHDWKLIPGNMMRLTTLFVESGRDFTCDQARTTQIPSFEYDYVNKMPQEFAATHFPDEDQERYAKQLEEWYAKRILSFTFSQLSRPNPGQPIYLDLACQVLQKRSTAKNITLTVWDGSQPSFSVKDGFDFRYCHSIFDGNWCIKNEEYLNMAHGKTVNITVWNNNSEQPIDHWLPCYKLDVEKCPAPVLLFLNVESSLTKDNEVLLVVRSGHHKGKAIRTIKTNSVLGRLMQSRLDDAVFIAESMACDELISITPSNETCASKTLTDEERDLIRDIPPHISLRDLIEFPDQKLDQYECLIRDSDFMNFCGKEFPFGFGKERFMSLIAFIRDIKDKKISFEQIAID